MLASRETSNLTQLVFIVTIFRNLMSLMENLLQIILLHQIHPYLKIHKSMQQTKYMIHLPEQSHSPKVVLKLVQVMFTLSSDVSLLIHLI